MYICQLHRNASKIDVKCIVLTFAFGLYVCLGGGHSSVTVCFSIMNGKLF